MTSRCSKGALHLLWLFCYVAGTTESALVRRNVTLSNVPYKRELAVPSGWGVKAVRSQSLQWSVGDCPVGRYCPAGTVTPLVCPAGTYSESTRLSTPCQLTCWVGWYCPDPGKRFRCPDNTYSTGGASSKLHCRCNAGYQCTYRKVVNVNLALRVPYQVWSSTGGKELRDAVVQAVARSAGVSNTSVQIRSAMPSVVQAPAAGSRRLLQAGTGTDSGSGGLPQAEPRAARALVSLSVDNGERIEGLLEGLGRAGEGARVAWRKVEEVRVVPEPARQNGWDWAGWLRRAKKG